jgi:secondary thiamine-phosphate synthase enzyme
VADRPPAVSNGDWRAALGEPTGRRRFRTDPGGRRSASRPAAALPAYWDILVEEMSIKQASYLLHLQTRGKGLYEFTGQVAAWLRERGADNGLLTIFCQHTSASLVIQENADADVMTDLDDFFSRIAPEDSRLYKHTIEGADDMPAHIRAALTQTQVSIPVVEGRMALGAWQGIFLFEHRAGGHRRSVLLHLMGE